MSSVVALDRARPGEPIFLRIVRAITEDIRRGRLTAGTCLPGTRTLAKSLGVNRNTVVAAFDELVAEGWLTTSPASATRVSESIPEPSRLGSVGPDDPRQFTHLAPEPDSEVGDAAQALSLSAGYPDLSLLPAEQLARAYRRAVKFAPVAALGYSDPRGVPALRDALADVLRATRGLPVTRSNVIVTRGSQMAFALVAESLLPPGARVAVEALGYAPAWAALRRRGAELIPIPIDDDGMRVDCLLDIHARAPFSAVYVTPHHQYPTTVMLSAGRRLQLLDFAARSGVIIVEDDYDHEFAFSGHPTLPLSSMASAVSVASRGDAHAGFEPERAPEARVIYIGTLSKVFAPGPRVGFIVTTAKQIDALAASRALIDTCGDPAIEIAIAELFVTGELRRHINRVRTVYARRLQTVVESLGRYLDGVVDYRIPSGGTALWLRARGNLDVDAWATATQRRGVTFHTGRRYALQQTPVACLRINFAALRDADIIYGVKALADALADLRNSAEQPLSG